MQLLHLVYRMSP